MALILVVAVGCSSSDSKPTTAPSKRTTTTTDPPPRYNPAGDAAFVAVVRSLPVLDRMGLADSEWIGLGHEVCTNVQRGDVAKGHGQGIVQEHLVLIARAGTRGWETGTEQAIMATATGILCPQYRKRWDAYLAGID